MTEKEKLIEIIKQNGTYNGRSMGVDYYVVDVNWIAELILKNGFGDIAEWKDKYARLEKSDASKENCTIEQHEEIHYLRDKLKQTQKECDEWEARAEKAETELEKYKRALSRACKASAAIPTKELVKARVDCFLRQAEKELQEERK